MVDKKSAYGDLVWGKGFFGLNSTAKAVKAAVEAQEKLSAALAKFNDRLAGNKDVTVEMQDAFTELQFQCDRRATEIYSIAVRMHDLVQKDVVNRGDARRSSSANSTTGCLNSPRDGIKEGDVYGKRRRIQTHGGYRGTAGRFRRT